MTDSSQSADPPQPLLIEFRNATIWRGSTRVFDSLNLAIAQHERVAILGPNGSGKTTLLKTINRELYPVAAPDCWVRILGRDNWNVWELREHIGVVSHDLHSRYTPTITALEVVISGYFSSIGVHGTLAERVRAANRACRRDSGHSRSRTGLPLLFFFWGIKPLTRATSVLDWKSLYSAK